MKIFQFNQKCGAEKFRFRAQGASLEELLVRILGTVGGHKVAVRHLLGQDFRR
jgi:hypothetical protein